MTPLRSGAVVDYEDELVAVIRHDARTLPFEDGSVDLIVTSYRNDRHSMIVGMGRKRLDPVDNWLSKTDIQGDDDCWEWQAGKDRDGYGKFAVGHGGNDQTHTRAHRFAYEIFVGPIPDGFAVCHSCDNPSCVNPAHLWVGTPRANNDDKVAKDRHAKLWGTPLNRARQTHCKRGHLLAGDNLRVDTKRGHRSCKICGREASRRYYRKKRNAP